ncbi:MAG: sugar phosphate isomerase/epimerase family protein [Pseudomonadota bacterium]
MQLAYSTNAFTRHSIEHAVKAIAELGFAGVELLCDRPHWFPGEVTETEVRRMRDALADHGLAVSNLNANTANGYYSPAPPENTFEPSMSNEDPELRRWRENYSIEAIKLAAAVGARAVSVTSGNPRAGLEPERRVELFVDSLRRICAEAERYGMRVGVEYEPGLLIERASELRAVIDAVDSPALGVNFDIGHSFLDGESPEEAVALLKGRIWNVHVEDIRGNKHYHLVPGDGELPFERYFNVLHQAGYDGFLTVELYTLTHAPVEAGERSLAHLTPLLPEASAAG